MARGKFLDWSRMNSLATAKNDILLPNSKLIHGAEVSRLDKAFIIGSGQSWWQVRYASGKIINEWKTKQFTSFFFPTKAQSGTTRWEEIPKTGIRGLYLLCPNGHVGALESDGDYQFFQLKSGSISVGNGSQGRSIRAHIIGKVDDENGSCVCWAWDYQDKALVRFTDNVTNLAYNGIGPLSLGEHTGVK